MNIVIFGAGAVGGYFGGRMAEAGFPVTFLVREKRFKQLQQRGLRIQSLNGDFNIEPTLATSPESIDQPDLVIVALKNYHLEGALPALEKLVAKGAKILPLLNGIQHLDVLIDKFGKENVLGGACYIESTLNEDGDVVHTSPMQDIVYGYISDGPINFLDSLEDIMTKSGINVKKSDKILEDMWQKYIFLASLSGITAAVRQPIGAALNDPVTYGFLEDLITEVAEVAKARGVHLPQGIVEFALQKMKSISPTMTASMHRDLEKGLPMELESLHGGLLKMANEHNVSTPCTRAVYALLHPYRNGKVIVKEEEKSK